jgi:RNA polymerase sigma-70 factor (ECF subfamily)
LTELFVPYVPSAAGAAPPLPALEEKLQTLLQLGRSTWPDLAVPEELFLRQVAQGVPEGGDVLAFLDQVHATDLYLVCGCLHGDSRAHAALEDHYLARLSEQITRTKGASFAGDVLQDLRTRLLLARDGLPPRIAGYHGRGPLAGWLKVAAARVTVDLIRSHRPDNIGSEDEAQLRAPAPDPEMEFLKQRYRREFEDAFRETLSALEDRDANVLRLYYLEGVPAEQIGPVYGVTGRSIQLWIAQARKRILRRTRRLLAERLRLTNSQLDGLTHLVQSQLDVSLHKILKKRDD